MGAEDLGPLYWAQIVLCISHKTGAVGFSVRHGHLVPAASDKK